uniref:Peptidase S1 domain-containing protein n=1 Tax=Clastoptera arizonana TaxID=38151 RepID=A0A1B6CT26_9HEMI
MKSYGYNKNNAFNILNANSNTQGWEGMMNIDQLNSTLDKDGFPWQAAILEEKENLTKFVCSGVLIHERFVLLSHKCKKEFVIRKLSVIFGVNDLKNILQNYSSTYPVYKVSKAIYEKDDKNGSHMILLKLKSLTNKNPICLNTDNKSKITITKHCYIIGWPLPNYYKVIRTLDYLCLINNEDVKNVVKYCICKDILSQDRCSKIDYVNKILSQSEDEENQSQSLFNSFYNSIHSYFMEISEPLKFDKIEGNVCSIQESLFLRKIPIVYISSRSILYIDKRYLTSVNYLKNLDSGSTIVCKTSRINKCMRREYRAKSNSLFSFVGSLDTIYKKSNSMTIQTPNFSLLNMIIKNEL